MTKTKTAVHTKDLTQGSIFKQMIIFALPLLAGQVFQTLYNSVDSVVIGRFDSAQALAAVSACGIIAMAISGFFNGLSGGASVMYARMFGAQDYKKLHDAVHTTMIFSFVLGTVLAGGGIIFTPAMLNFTACPEEVFTPAVIYLRIYLIGVLFTSIYNVAAGILRAVGDSRSPFIFLVTSSILNIILDLVFVAWMGMGVVGVAVATVISQGVSMILAFIRIMRLDESYRFRFSHLMVDWKLLGEVVRLGIPAGLQSSITAISNLYVQRYINSFSTFAIAGIGAAMRVDQFAGMPCQALGLAMTTFIGQNIGAGKNDRAHKSVLISIITTIAFVVIVSIPIYIFSPSLISIFTTNQEVIMYGTGMLRVIMPVYTFMGLNMLMGGVDRGFGFSLSGMIVSIIGMVGARQLWLALTLNFVEHNINFVYWGYPIGWACSVTGLVILYLTAIRRKYPSKQKTA